MQNKNKELTMDFIGSKRYSILQGINNAYLNFQWEIGQYFIDQKKENNKVFITAESQRLMEKWGNNFSVDNVTMAIAFAQLVTDEIQVGVLGSVISWKYLKVMLPLNDVELIFSLTKVCIDENLSIEVLQKSVNKIIAGGDVPKLPKVKRKKTKVDYLYSTEMVEYDKNSPVPFRSHDILIFDSSRQLAPDGIINNLFPDNDLESFLKLDRPNGEFMRG
ncbi:MULTISPECIES: DUF1016 N-terminal domain-containing protein [unclassified Sphingobacterium]|uniref:DUF1016 N-terminal domain-containing protein n=1 Tax=unclassified Sphingobacterium TaxID=2609468 RepID=UPI00104592AC|nr:MULTISPECIES: DUF1016 N-terminal domain-containing protein [unclassified Sphingobacterium]MCS3556921.1 hypothetical protein [Sphingobacterium sp. JUb21]TCQ98926.1 uncharacterized protein DUF1016 [Sphingobacterium sp. JUb20]